jgi:hypothetical protein
MLLIKMEKQKVKIKKKLKLKRRKMMKLQKSKHHKIIVKLCKKKRQFKEIKKLIPN